MTEHFVDPGAQESSGTRSGETQPGVVPRRVDQTEHCLPSPPLAADGQQPVTAAPDISRGARHRPSLRAEVRPASVPDWARPPAGALHAEGQPRSLHQSAGPVLL